jgi:hypothetical protein
MILESVKIKSESRSLTSPTRFMDNHVDPAFESPLSQPHFHFHTWPPTLYLTFKVRTTVSVFAPFVFPTGFLEIEHPQAWTKANANNMKPTLIKLMHDDKSLYPATSTHQNKPTSICISIMSVWTFARLCGVETGRQMGSEYSIFSSSSVYLR